MTAFCLQAGFITSSRVAVSGRGLKQGLLLQTPGRGRLRHEPIQVDGVAGFLAKPVTSAMDPLQRLVDRVQVLALALEHAKIEGMPLFDRCAVGWVGGLLGLVQMACGLARRLLHSLALGQ